VSTASDLIAPASEDEPWTIVGSVLDPEDGAATAAVWTSEDAVEWERSGVDPHRRGASESMAAAVPTDDGLLAVGRAGDGDESDAAVWRQDGDGWVQARPEAMAGEHEQWAFDVAAGAGGLVAAGGESAWGEVRARLWFSADGETWETVDGGPGGPLDATGEESVRDVTSFGNGFVAVGSTRVDNEQDGAVWYSADGRSWEQVDSPGLAGPGRQELSSVVDVGTGLVAGGYADGDGGMGVAVSWTSPDARTWTGSAGNPLPLQEGRSEGANDMTIRSLTVDGAGILAAGGSEWRPHVWRSTDGGQTWALQPNPVHGGLFEDGVQIEDAAGSATVPAVAIGSGPSVLRFGTRWEDVTGDAFPRGGAVPFATSVAESPDVTIAGGGRLTPASGVEREKYTGQIWRQGGNGAWEAIDSDPLSSGRVLDVVPFKGGFVAVGMEDFGLAATRDISNDALPDGMVWISPDGETWGRIGTTNARIDDASLAYLEDQSPENASVIVELERGLPPESLAPAGGPGTRSLAAAAPMLDGFIAVGSAFAGVDADPIVLLSLDGATVQEDPTGIGGPGIQTLNDVCVAEDNTTVAVGLAGSTGTHDAIVLHRAPADGAWTPATVADGSFGGAGNQLTYGCAVGPDGFIIVGSDDASGDTDARVWTSEDGLEWTQIEAGPLGGGGDQWASAASVVPDGDEADGWLVAGTDTSHGDGDVALWRVSADGDVARRDEGERSLAGPGDQAVTGVVVDADGHVTLAGSDYGRVGLWESDRLDR
jgi:hypothetical protein